MVFDWMAMGEDVELHTAARAGDVQAAATALSRGARINAPRADGMTPLHVAAQYGHADIISLLLRHNAKTDARNMNHMTPLHIAAEAGRTAAVTALVSHPRVVIDMRACRSMTPLFVATQCFGGCSEAQTEVVAILLAHRAAVNAPDADGMTPLHNAAARGSDAMAELLLRHGAVSSARTKLGHTPLHFAAAEGRLPVVQMLLSAGAPANAASSWGETPLSEAARFGHTDVHSYLTRWRDEHPTSGQRLLRRFFGR